MRLRPIASICCSPPDKNSCLLFATLGEPRKHVKDASPVVRNGTGGSPQCATELQVFVQRQIGEYLASFGDMANTQLAGFT